MVFAAAEKPQVIERVLTTMMKEESTQGVTMQTGMQNFISTYREHMWITRYTQNERKIINKVNNKTAQRNVNIIKDVR